MDEKIIEEQEPEHRWHNLTAEGAVAALQSDAEEGLTEGAGRMR